MELMKRSLNESFAEISAKNTEPGMPTSSNPNSNNILNMIIRKDDEIKRYENNILKFRNEILELSNRYIIITNLLNELNEDQKKVYNYYYYKNLTIEKTIPCVHMSDKTIKKRRNEIIKKLKLKLEEDIV